MNIFSSNQSKPPHERLAVAMNREVLAQRAELLRMAGARGISALERRYPGIIASAVEAKPEVAQPEARQLQSAPLEQDNTVAQDDSLITASELLARAQENLRKALDEAA